MKLKVIVASSAEELEKKVNDFFEKEDEHLHELHCNFQRNVFYKREGGVFGDQLTETWTAFLVFDGW